MRADLGQAFACAPVLLCREMRSMFLVAPLVGLGSAAPAFVLAHHFDLPPAQLTVALLCGVLLLAWAGGRASLRLRSAG